MYCPSCGAEINDEVSYCPECGEATGPVDGTGEESSISRREYYDFVMSIQDGWGRSKFARAVVDFVGILVTGGIWLGVMAAEVIYHHYELKRGNREPFDEKRHKSEWHLWSVDDAPEG